ncbi:peptidase M14 [Pseudoalteromonas sp. MT33b]|uniref:M14 family zinc carboxypeptidase n=1 Tax=Pseudoalteromonas sp. MT33b TaxID=2759705 RepID=UPI0015F9928C|nr:M14 family zinc carboxypeptidase [Pseudoalteromonas sp. MT33b]QMW13755.1 peptidase M14 [Pseudoalteromonas sp. MT33b]
MYQYALTTALLLSSSHTFANSIEDTRVHGFDKPAIYYSDIEPQLKKAAMHPAITLQQLGSSYQGQPINALDIGSGAIKVMMWSQMHGDENTATAALMDFLTFITAPENAAWLKEWQTKLTLRIIPMVNPDGAAIQTRHNAQGIDLNRDAKALRTQEGQILMAAATQFKPDFGFNLHDQNAYYGAGKKGKQATISVLAPAYNEAREINTTRAEAMQFTAHLAATVENMIPGHLGKYNDSYSYRSFGDTFSEKGIRTILIESGAYPQDPNRQVARKVNRVLYKKAIDSLVTGDWKKATVAQYHAIPFNAKDNWVDLLIDDVMVNSEMGDYQIDIAINDKGRLPTIKELGDISSIRQGYQTLDASKLSFNIGNSYIITKPITLTDSTYKALLKEGYSCFSGQVHKLTNNSQWPIYTCPRVFTSIPTLHAPAAFLLTANHANQYAVLGAKLIGLN